MTSKRNYYTEEFRETAISLALESDKPIAEVARDLGIKENTLYNWLGRYHDPNKLKSKENPELKELKKKLRLVTMERDILKKATAYFAKESQ